MITATTLADAGNIRTTNDIFDLEDAYIEYVKTQVQGDRQGVWHPSALGMCGRFNVYDFTRAPQVRMRDEDDEERFRMGHAVHALVQGAIADMGRVLAPKGIQFSFEAEKPYNPQTDVLFTDFGVGGTTDGVLEIWKPNEWHQRGILEVKSIKDELWKELKGPKDDHMEQAHLYAFRFDCPIMWFWYYNKNTSQRQVFRRVYDPRVFQRAISKIEGWLAHAQQGTLTSV